MGRSCCGIKSFIETGVIVCPLSPSVNIRPVAVIAGAPTMHSSPPTWFNAAIAVNYASLTVFVPIVAITKVEKLSR